MSHIFSAGDRCLRGQIENPKLEIRNKPQIQMTNSQNPTNQPACDGVVFEDLLLCSLRGIGEEAGRGALPIYDFRP